MPNVPTKLPRYRDLPAVPGNPPKTAWGLFGADDNVGMFNLAIGEMFQTTQLAADCARDGVYEGLFVSAPLNIAGGTDSPPNALVIK